VHDVLSDPDNAVLAFCVIISAALLVTRCVPEKTHVAREAAALLGVALFLVAGALASTPPWYQYFYASVPFFILMIPYAAASLPKEGARLALALFTVAIVVSLAHGFPQYLHVRHLLVQRFGEWVPVQAQHVGTEIRDAVGAGRVLTLAPIFPLEGGAKIYCEFAEGPFFWRAGHLLSAAERSKLGIVSPVDLSQFLKGQAPDGILVGFEEADIEAPLIAYARRNGYRVRQLSDGGDLWVSLNVGVAHQGSHGSSDARQRRFTEGCPSGNRDQVVNSSP
jgi:hypothetical protein